MMRTKDNITSSVATIASCAAALLMFMSLGAKAQSISASDDDEVDRTPHIHGTLRSKYEYQTSEGEGRFEVRNARVSVDGKVTPFISYKAEIDLCDEGSIKMLDAYTRLNSTVGVHCRTDACAVHHRCAPLSPPAIFR